MDQSNIFSLNSNQSDYLIKMSSSSNLYHYLKHRIDKNDDDNSDNDFSIDINPIAMTSSTSSSDSAIVSDDIDDNDLKNPNRSLSRNSWPKIFKTVDSKLITFSPSFNLLNLNNQQTIHDNETSISKYTQPLPWKNPKHYQNYTQKVFILFFRLFNFLLYKDRNNNVLCFSFIGLCNTCPRISSIA